MLSVVRLFEYTEAVLGELTFQQRHQDPDGRKNERGGGYELEEQEEQNIRALISGHWLMSSSRMAACRAYGWGQESRGPLLSCGIFLLLL